jgi:asparaginyl-tRNA synthetase
VERLRQLAASPFARMTYSEAHELLRTCGKTFEVPVPEWGGDFVSEHERYICE